MAREKLYMCPTEGVKYLKPAHNPTGELVKVILASCIVRRRNKKIKL